MAPDLNLTTGQVLHALWRPRVSRRDRVGPSNAFKARLVYLRKMGVPFSSAEAQPGSGVNLKYGFRHLAELSVAMELIDHGVQPADVANLLVSQRDRLTVFYGAAYENWNTREEIGLPSLIGADGLFLEMTVFYEDDEPYVRGLELLKPSEAAARLLITGNKVFSRFFIALSDLLYRTTQRALTAPETRRGRQS